MFRWYLSKTIRRGRMVLIESNGRITRFGEAGDGPALTLRVHDRKTMWRLSTKPNLALGEAYMNGTLTIENGTIRDVIALVFDNMADAPVDLPEQAIERPFRPLLRRLRQYNPMRRSQRNVSHHYDLSRRLFQRHVRVGEIGAGILLVGVEEQIEEAPRQVVVVGDVPL